MTYTKINIYERHAQYTERTALSQTGGYSATLNENRSNIYFYLFLFFFYLKLQKKKEQNRTILLMTVYTQT